MSERSPLNKGRTTKRNARRQARNAVNRTKRAELHSAKALTSDPNKIASIQNEIDNLSIKGA